MSTRAPAPPLSFVARLDGGRLNYKGGILAGVRVLFVGLPDALSRRKMLDALEKEHVALLTKEGAV